MAKVRHYVRFYSPGTLFHETETADIDSWDVNQAVGMSKDVVARYGAKPFGFQFITRTLGDDDFEPTETGSSSMYYLGGKILTLAEVKEAMPDHNTLICNMEGNKWDRIIVNTNSYKVTVPFNDGDTLLDV